MLLWFLCFSLPSQINPTSVVIKGSHRMTVWMMCGLVRSASDIIPSHFLSWLIREYDCRLLVRRQESLLTSTMCFIMWIMAASDMHRLHFLPSFCCQTFPLWLFRFLSHPTKQNDLKISTSTVKIRACWIVYILLKCCLLCFGFFLTLSKR